jgi:hypothetical protein
MMKNQIIKKRRKSLSLWKDADWDSCLDGNGVRKD